MGVGARKLCQARPQVQSQTLGDLQIYAQTLTGMYTHLVSHPESPAFQHAVVLTAHSVPTTSKELVYRRLAPSPFLSQLPAVTTSCLKTPGSYGRRGYGGEQRLEPDKTTMLSQLIS